MDRQRSLLLLAQNMSAAIAAEDWSALTAINTMMSASLPKMAAQGAWTPAERAALAALRDLHLTAQARCAKATDDLARRLRDMQNNKEGWIAYALNNELAELAETGIQA